MKMDKFAEILEKINRETGKFYTFLEDHNPRLPADYWFQHPPEGLTLFLVFTPGPAAGPGAWDVTSPPRNLNSRCPSMTL